MAFPDLQDHKRQHTSRCLPCLRPSAATQCWATCTLLCMPITYTSGRCDHRCSPAAITIVIAAITIVDALASTSDSTAAITIVIAAAPIDDRGELAWILKMAVTRDRSSRTITISKEQYIDRVLQRYLPEGPQTRGCTSPMDETKPLTSTHGPTTGTAEHDAMDDKRATYMSAVGSLLWLAACTRLDIAYTVSVLARYCSNPAMIHYSCCTYLATCIIHGPLYYDMHRHKILD